MWPFFKQKQKPDEIPQSATVKHDATDKSKNMAQRRRPMAFSEIIEGMGDFSDLTNHDVALKFWLPEAAEQALGEIIEREGLSASEFLRQFLAIHCYGLYAFYLMTDAMPRLFRERDNSIRFSMAEPPPHKKRIVTYWVPELGKNVVAVKVWVPSRLKNDLQILSAHAGLTVSNYVREILISRLLGHGMLPQRPGMFKAFPAPAAEDWNEDHEVPWREISENERCKYGVVDIRSEWVDDAITDITA